MIAHADRSTDGTPPSGASGEAGETPDATAAEAAIDAVPRSLDVLCRVTGLRFAALVRLSGSQWVACAVRDEIEAGIAAGDVLPADATLCQALCRSGEPVVLDDVASHGVLADHPMAQRLGLRSYISVPVRRPDGSLFGALCAFDKRPAALSDGPALELSWLCAELIGRRLGDGAGDRAGDRTGDRAGDRAGEQFLDQARLQRSEAELSDARETAGLREQFIAALGHDLRNPLASIDSGLKLLRRKGLDERGEEIVELMHRSVSRMLGLIDNVTDFAQGRLGQGIALDAEPDPRLGDALEQVVDELRSAWTERRIDSDIALDRAVVCDSARVAQLLSNLLANALTHGDPVAPVSVRARSDSRSFVLSVANQGPPIPPEVARELFRPFAGHGRRRGDRGLGLGLYIAAELARAHGGTLDYSSTEAETCFVFRMPVEGPGAASPAA